jgi:periplasmic divalent cation tolerance protein
MAAPYRKPGIRETVPGAGIPGRSPASLSLTQAIHYLRTMNERHCIVLCTAPDPATAETLARAVVEARVAACVNLLPGMRSIYRWQGAVQQDSETLLIIKTRSDRFAALSSVLQALHPYELPEIIAVPLSDGLPAYLAWVDQNTDQTPETSP